MLHVDLQAELMEQQTKQKAEQEARQVALQAQLDKVVEDKVAQRQRMAEQDRAEDRNIELFQQAKKVHRMCGGWHCVSSCSVPVQRMTRLRKEKEAELFSQFQSQQQRMCDLLVGQRKQELSSEDERIARAVADQDAKREASTA